MLTWCMSILFEQLKDVSVVPQVHCQIRALSAKSIGAGSQASVALGLFNPIHLCLLVGATYNSNLFGCVSHTIKVGSLYSQHKSTSRPIFNGAVYKINDLWRAVVTQIIHGHMLLYS